MDWKLVATPYSFQMSQHVFAVACRECRAGGIIEWTLSGLLAPLWASSKSVYFIGCDYFYSNEARKRVSKMLGGGRSDYLDPNRRKLAEIVHEGSSVWLITTMLGEKFAEQRDIRIL